MLTISIRLEFSAWFTQSVIARAMAFRSVWAVELRDDYYPNVPGSTFRQIWNVPGQQFMGEPCQSPVIESRDPYCPVFGAQVRVSGGGRR